VEANEEGKERTKEEVLSRRAIDHVFVGKAEDLHDAGELLLFILAWKDWEAGVELGEDAPETPHVDRPISSRMPRVVSEEIHRDGGRGNKKNEHVVVCSENDFRRTVEPTLDVCVD
jgi:hypothetical protein